MISGRLDRLSSAGFVEGWAFDSQTPERSLAIEVRAGYGALVAEGLANLYRDDLANARQGLGWCAFRLRLSRPPAEFRGGRLFLHDKRSGARIDVPLEIPFVAGRDEGSAGQNAFALDPFVFSQISQLRACEELFANFVRSKSAGAFVRASYIYMLGRPADPETFALHAEMLRDGKFSPFRLLQMIAETREFRAHPRELAAPNAPGFPFVGAAHVG